jgi:dolichol-phosphate mannosyltransferase
LTAFDTHQKATQVTGNPKTPPATTISIVIPTLREAVNIPILMNQIEDTLGSAGMLWEAVIVDDDSRDGTDDVCRNLARRGLPLTLHVRRGRRGLSTAVLEGFCRSRGEVFVVMDADLSHPVAKIPDLVQALERGADLSIGSRYLAGGGTDDHWTVYRYLNSKIATLLARGLIRLSDPMSGFFAIKRQLWERSAPMSPLGYKIALELIIKGNAVDIAEIPIHFRTRQYGHSKLTLRQQMLYLRHLGRLYRHKFGYRQQRRPRGMAERVGRIPQPGLPRTGRKEGHGR